MVFLFLSHSLPMSVVYWGEPYVLEIFPRTENLAWRLGDVDLGPAAESINLSGSLNSHKGGGKHRHDTRSGI